MKLSVGRVVCDPLFIEKLFQNNVRVACILIIFGIGGESETCCWQVFLSSWDSAHCGLLTIGGIVTFLLALTPHHQPVYVGRFIC